MSLGRTRSQSHPFLNLANQEMFQEYMARSEAFFSAAGAYDPTEDLPVGFAEVVSHRMTVRIISGDASTAEVESFCCRPQDPPQLKEAASETELYAFMMQAYREFEQAVYKTAYLESSDAGGLPSENEAGIRTACSSRVREASMAVVDTMASRINNHSCDFARLEDVADRPLIRQGIGGLIINGTLVFEKAAKGDFSGAVERIDRWVPRGLSILHGVSRTGVLWPRTNVGNLLQTACAKYQGYARFLAVPCVPGAPRW
ncbi:unnamed protein product, partial [Ectocarpus sp. 12 AP-2014]